MAALAICALAAACGGGSAGDEEGDAEPTTVTIYVEQSIEATMRVLEETLETDRSDIQVDLVVGPSDQLREAIQDGEEADIIVSRSSDVDILRAEDRLTGDALVFGADALVIVVPEGNPDMVEDLSVYESDNELVTGLCEATKPCGVTGGFALVRASIQAPPDEVLPDGASLLLSVIAGDVDVALLMRTQAASRADAVTAIELPADYNGHVDLSIAAVRDSPVIRDTVDWLASSAAAGEILRSHGLREAPEDTAE
jgi:ABC-type molybdate transport system substrate-binding protein